MSELRRKLLLLKKLLLPWPLYPLRRPAGVVSASAASGRAIGHRLYSADVIPARFEHGEKGAEWV